MASASVEIPKLGGAIAGRVRRFKRASIRCVGAQAAYRCIKAVVNARDYIREDEGSSRDRVLALTLSEQALPVDGSDSAKRTVMLVEAEPMDMPSRAAGAATRELIVGAQTNAGKAAAAIAASMRQGPGASALVRAMGANAVHQSLIASALAKKYLENDGDGVRFAIVPSFEDQNEPPKGVKPIRQLVLSVLRTDG